MKMDKSVLIAGVFFSLISSSSQNLGAESENPSAFLWLERDWYEDNQSQIELIKDYLSGCICRFNQIGVAECYGGKICNVFPKNLTLQPEISEFSLKTSAVRSIDQEDLLNFVNLTVLVIDGNNHLTNINPKTFDGMTNLQNLSISYNSELKKLHPDTFYGLENLKLLRLIRNGFTDIFDATVALKTHYLPNLVKLSLNENSFPMINKTSFSSLANSNISEIELVLCQIQFISKKSLNYFQRLKVLRLGDNLISENDLISLFNELKNNNILLNLLNLFNLGFGRDGMLKELLNVLSHHEILHLILSRNHIESISADLFPSMPFLEILDLRETSVVNIVADALSPERLPKLTTLLLAGNKLPGVVPGVLLPQIAVLDLSENSGGIHSPSYFDVSSSITKTPLNIKSLDLSFNKISTLSKLTFQNFHSLEVLGLKNATIFYIPTDAFLTLRNLKVLNLENNALKPFNQFKTPIFNGLINLESLNLARCKIMSFTDVSIFQNLTNLKYLNLQDNELLSIEPELVKPLVSLVGIDLSDNRIQPWMARRRFQNNPNLKIIILHSNRLNTITAVMIEDFINSTRLDITRNAYFCDCWAFNQTMIWLQENGKWANETTIGNPNHVCSAPENWRGQSIATYLDSTEMCLESPTKFYATSLFIFLHIIIIAILLGGLSYYYRWHLRYWIFLTRMSFLRKHSWLLKNENISRGEYQYDVFVSYSHEDKNFIVRLVAMLENQAPFLKLCVYERDFEIGTVISDTVMAKVAASRRTLLIVSNSFAKSQWCMWELQLAESHRLFFRNLSKEVFEDDPLVIIKLGPIAQSNMTPTLKFLMKSRIYLEWNHDAKKQVSFWEKLRSTLGSHDTNNSVEKRPENTES